MFNFAYPLYLLFLLLVPLFVVVYFWGRWLRRKNLAKFGKNVREAGLMPMASPYKPPIKITIEMLALTCLIFAFARPWGGFKEELTETKGIEVVIAVDASNSMLASVDGSEKGASRMRTAKTFLERLLGQLDNDRVGIMVYAGDAKTLIPLSGDYVSAKMFLNSIDPNSMATQGTNMTSALDLAIRMFNKKSTAGKAIILITDAEELQDEEGVMQAAEAAADRKIQLDVVGIGSDNPATIPYRGGYLMDPSTGQPVQTVLNEDLAAQIAKAGKGIYINASNDEALSELGKQLSTLKKSTMQNSVYAVHDELYVGFAIAALVLIIIDIFLLERKIGWLSKIAFFKKENK